MASLKVFHIYIHRLAVLFLSVSSLSILTEKEALLSFKSRITADALDALSLWDRGSGPCNWTGVFLLTNLQGGSQVCISLDSN